MQSWSLFFGSFHPVVVHLPIGALMVAVLLQTLTLLPRFKHLGVALPWLYGFGFAGAAVAVVSGWSLAGPVGASWDTHRWFGLGTLFLAGVLFVLSVRHRLAAPTRGVTVGSAALAFLTLSVTGWTGHLGGALTYGENHFQQYAPDVLAKALDTLPPLTVADRDSTVVYADLVHPILVEKCVDCHRAELDRGGLVMTSYADLTEGGSEGDAIGAGLSGELWKRVTLPTDHPRFMPSRGAALSYDELLVLRSWLVAHLDSAATVEVWQPDEETIGALRRIYRRDFRPLPYVDKVNPPAVALDAVPEVWRIAPLSQESNLLEAQLREVNVDADEALAGLKIYAANVTALDLRGLRNADAWLAGLPALPHLTSVNLAGSDVTAAGVPTTARFPHLTKVNLWDTPAYQPVAEAGTSL